MSDRRGSPPLSRCLPKWDQVDAVYRARFDAEVTTRTLRCNHCMHEFGSTQNGVDGAGLYALGAADTLSFTNHGDQRRLALTVARIKGFSQFLQ